MGFANPAAGASIIQIPPHGELLVAHCARCCYLGDNDDDRPSMKHQNEIDLFTGCEMALVVAFVVIIHARNIMEKKGFVDYMANMFHLYSLFAFIVLHMVMYDGNIYFWRSYRIIYPFIFCYKQGTELGYIEIFLLSVGLATLALASVLANMDMEMDEKTKDYSTLTELPPLRLVAIRY